MATSFYLANLGRFWSGQADFGQRTPPRTTLRRTAGPPSAGPALRRTAQNFALFFPSPATIFILFLSLWGSSRVFLFSLRVSSRVFFTLSGGILVVFWSVGTSNVLVFALGLSCGSPWRPPGGLLLLLLLLLFVPGVSHDRPKLQNCTFEGPGLHKNHQNSTKRPPRKEERMKMEAGEGKKKREILATLRAPHPFSRKCPKLTVDKVGRGQSRKSCWPKSVVAKVGRARWNPPSWHAVVTRVRPQQHDWDQEPGSFERGGHHQATSRVERQHREVTLFPKLSDSGRALVRARRAASRDWILTSSARSWSVVFPLTVRICWCGRSLGAHGHHRAACARAGVLGRDTQQSVAARICHKAGVWVTSIWICTTPETSRDWKWWRTGCLCSEEPNLLWNHRGQCSSW